MNRLAGKAALITGGNGGIGLATARLFVAEGARVAISGRSPERLRAAAAELGPDVLTLSAEAASAASMEAACAQIAERFGGLDIVFANAGIAGGTTLDLASLDDFIEIIRANVTGSFITLAAAAPYLRDGASLILTGSVMADLGFPGASAYSASKGAIRSLAKSLAGELAPRGIRVNVVAPGPIRTPIWQEERLAAVAASISLGRVGEAEEVANVALFLASDESAFITATEIFVDGGSIGTPAGAPIYRSSTAA